MPIQVFGGPETVIEMNLALYGAAPGYATYPLQLGEVGAANTNLVAYANKITESPLVHVSDANLAAAVLTNLLGNDAANSAGLRAAVASLFAAHAANRGVVIYQLAELLQSLEGDATFGAAAVTWNQTILNSYNMLIAASSEPPKVLSVSPKVIAQAYVLTQQVDTFTGTAADERFVGTEATLNAGDTLAGNGGNDVLLVSTSGVAAVSKSGFTTTGIQTLSVTSDAVGGTGMDTSGMTGLTALVNDNSSTNLSFNQAANLMSLTARNVSGGDTTINYVASAVAGKVDVMAITLNNNKTLTGGSVGAVRADGIETFNITTSGGASNIAELKSSTLQNVVIQGDQSLTLHQLSFFNLGGTNTVDASALTGKLDLALASNPTTTVVSGGQNTDTLHLSGNRGDYQLTVAAAGGNTSVNVHDLRITLLPVGDVHMTNVERLAFNDRGLALDMGINQAGGKTVVLLAEALGVGFLQDASLTAKALTYFDNGASLQDGANLLLASGVVTALAGGSGNAALVNFVYHNVFGSAPDAATLALLQAPLDNHSLTQAQWLAAVAQAGVVQDQVHLAGYAQTGLAFAI
jgi:hypothetical protein